MLRARSWAVGIVLVFVVRSPADAGFMQTLADGTEYLGRHLNAATHETDRVQRAIDRLRAVDPVCADCLQSLFDAQPQKICAETKAATNGHVGASTARGPDATCNDAKDYINVNPTFLENTTPPGLLKTILGHECCHTMQPDTLPEEDSELPCYRKELALLQANAKDPDLNSGEKDAFAARIEFVKGHIAALENAAKKAGKKSSRLDDSRTPKFGAVMAYLADGSSALAESPRARLLVASPIGTPGGPTRVRLRRSTPPRGKVTVLTLAAAADAVLVGGVDRRGGVGVLKMLPIAGGAVGPERFEQLLPGVHPLSVALDQPAGRLFVLDTRGNRLLCLEDDTGDGIPDTVRDYATAARFPVLTGALAVGFLPQGGPRDVLVAGRDLRAVDHLDDAVEVTTALVDDDGDCVADRAIPTTVGPGSTTTTTELQSTSTTTVTTSTSSTTTTTGPIPCGLDGGTGFCGGVCPGSDVCLALGGTCQCLPPAAACGAQGFPACTGGRCPALFQQCLVGAGACECQ